MTPPNIDAVWIRDMPTGADVPLLAYSPALRIGAAPHGFSIVWFRVDCTGTPLPPSIEEPKSPTADLILWRLSQTYMALAMAQHDVIPSKA
jgi:hypothetical protein